MQTLDISDMPGVRDTDIVAYHIIGSKIFSYKKKNSNDKKTSYQELLSIEKERMDFWCIYSNYYNTPIPFSKTKYSLESLISSPYLINLNSEISETNKRIKTEIINFLIRLLGFDNSDELVQLQHSYAKFKQYRYDISINRKEVNLEQDATPYLFKKTDQAFSRINEVFNLGHANCVIFPDYYKEKKTWDKSNAIIVHDLLEIRKLSLAHGTLKEIYTNSSNEWEHSEMPVITTYTKYKLRNRKP